MAGIGEYSAEDAHAPEHEALVEKHESSDTIKVSSTAHSVFFYVDLATKFLVDHDEIHLSGLGKTVTVVATLSEILTKQGVATIKGIKTSLVPLPPDQRKPGSGKTNKAKIDITIVKAPTYLEYIQKKKATSEENRIIREKLEDGRQKMQAKLKVEANA